jgi:hypothetical protein
MSYKEKGSGEAVERRRSVWLCDLLDASYPRFIAGIDPAKWYGTPWHTNDVFVVGNVQ